MNSKVVSFIALAVALVIGSIIKDAMRAPSKANIPFPVKENVQADVQVDVMADMDAYVNLPLEISEASDSIPITELAEKISKYSSNDLDHIDSFARLYTRFVIDLQNDQYTYYYAKAIEHFESPYSNSYTDREYDSLLNFYHYSHIADMKNQEENAIDHLADSLSKKSPKNFIGIMKIIRSNTQSALIRNYYLIFKKVYLYI